MNKKKTGRRVQVRRPQYSVVRGDNESERINSFPGCSGIGTNSSFSWARWSTKLCKIHFDTL